MRMRYVSKRLPSYKVPPPADYLPAIEVLPIPNQAQGDTIEINE